MSKPDGDMIYELFVQIRDLYRKDKKAKFPNPILNLKWDYATDNKFDPHLVAKTINGYWTKIRPSATRLTRKASRSPAFAMLQDDGSTACGNWIYCQSYNQDGNNMARRDKYDPSGIGLYPKWSWAWPVNRRIIYNRASVDPDRKAVEPQKSARRVCRRGKGRQIPAGKPGKATSPMDRGLL